ncbi:Putative two-domain glycosyltransferase [Arcticibacter svalbardensis MN12-7]|uniref:Putative two-domain glycosyltransferase n=1 Tax=Arcticibacter svalbardensis MN12-7 TaxID=1150600 RepID=R9GR11_9SPHI|nr:Putative two-domain glycosyltransferase [Arcticibacter svalbardensis MN12-7]
MNQKQLPDEVLIADDGSGEETKKVIDYFKSIFPVPLIHVWQQDEGFRKAEILNKTIRESSFTYVVQIDGDVILHPDFIKDHLLVREEGAFVRGTRAMLTHTKTIEVLKTGDIRLHFFSKGVQHRINAFHIPMLRQLGIRKVWSSRSVRGSNLAFWKSDFIRVNGYDNQLKGWGHEDEELAARFINNHIIKKIVKLCAVQFHLYHAVASRKNEPAHADLVKNTVNNKLKTCVQGYNN